MINRISRFSRLVDVLGRAHFSTIIIYLRDNSTSNSGYECIGVVSCGFADEAKFILERTRLQQVAFCHLLIWLTILVCYFIVGLVDFVHILMDHLFWGCFFVESSVVKASLRNNEILDHVLVLRRIELWSTFLVLRLNVITVTDWQRHKLRIYWGFALAESRHGFVWMVINWN